jgi:hypothetical protein
MNEERLREARRIPLPQGPEHEAWIFDVTPTHWLRRTWPANKCPYRYTAAGVWVRKAMPRSGRVRAERLLAKLADFAERMQGDLHDDFRVPRDTPTRLVAELILARALVEERTPFVVYNVEPTGRVWFFHRCERTASWHPRAPRSDAPSKSVNT